MLPAGNVLHLINQDVIVLVGNEMRIDIVIELCVVLDEIKIFLLLVDIDYICISFSAVTCHKVFHDKTFAYTTLPYKDNDLSFSQPGIYLLCIIFSL